MRMAAMPAAQSGLLAEAVKFTGDLSCEPLAGDVTVTTGVVAKAVRLRVIELRVSNAEINIRRSRSRGLFMKRPRDPAFASWDVGTICNADFRHAIRSIPKKYFLHSLGAKEGGSDGVRDVPVEFRSLCRRGCRDPSAPQDDGPTVEFYWHDMVKRSTDAPFQP